ncbi:hypothetical protein DMN91_008052 [Ooceraea biroi]|uniref:Uncharacterized protein n=2 Tax=Ooceraea biroi TaxID=2015173 RepID=A0A3L8DGC5_OOCBI|nr:ribonuclease P protein subunit p20 isoform X2 [Ooceraea biroi]RLU19495.1 hypothetical protein DMN91_008052 [Ooceraea biroi]
MKCQRTAMEVDNNLNLSEPVSKQKSLSRRNGKTLASDKAKNVLEEGKPFKLRKSDKDIYVNNKTNFKGQLYRCEKLFDKGASQLTVHGRGAAVYKACNLALQLQELHYGTLELDIKTSTETSEDKLKASDDAGEKVSGRQNSAVHIRVFRTLSLPKLR